MEIDHEIFSTVIPSLLQIKKDSCDFQAKVCAQVEGWSQDCSKSDGSFSQYLISSPWSHYEDYNISFCKQWKCRCHCSYEQWHLICIIYKGVKVAPKQGFQKICLSYYSLALNPRSTGQPPIGLSLPRKKVWLGELTGSTWPKWVDWAVKTSMQTNKKSIKKKKCLFKFQLVSR